MSFKEELKKSKNDKLRTKELALVIVNTIKMHVMYVDAINKDLERKYAIRYYVNISRKGLLLPSIGTVETIHTSDQYRLSSRSLFKLPIPGEAPDEGMPISFVHESMEEAIEMLKNEGFLATYGPRKIPQNLIPYQIPNYNKHYILEGEIDLT